MKLTQILKQKQKNLREGRYLNEAEVIQGVILPILLELGWPVDDTSVVVPQHKTDSKNHQVDLALCLQYRKPQVYIEVKAVGKIDPESSVEQLFNYALQSGEPVVPLAVLTDGQEWNFYLPEKQGRFNDRKVCRLDILESDLIKSQKILEGYLSYENIKTGKAFDKARADYTSGKNNKVAEKAVPKAYEEILKDKPDELIKIISKKTEALSGYIPSEDSILDFLEQLYNSWIAASHSYHEKNYKVSINENIDTRVDGKYLFICDGRKHLFRNSKELMVNIFKFLAECDNTFLERFASRKHGIKRKYVAKDKYDLYGNRKDLAERFSAKITSEWWIGTNYSDDMKKKILQLALEVAAPSLANHNLEIIINNDRITV